MKAETPDENTGSATRHAGSAGSEIEKNCHASLADEGSGKARKNNALPDGCDGWNKTDKSVLSQLSHSKHSGAKATKTKPVPLSDYEADATLKDIQADIKKRPKELPKLCPSSFSSFSAMNGRGQRGEAEVHRSFHGVKGFGRFLIEMGGPKRRESDSIDQIKPEDGYMPGNIRWRSKKGQGNNRTTTVPVYDPTRREWRPRAEVARDHGFSEAAVRKEMSRYKDRPGYSPEQVIQTMLDRRAERSAQTKRGKTVLPDRAEAESQTPNEVSGSPEPIPPAPLRLASDPRKRWPWPLTKAQREEWERLYQQNRLLRDDGFEWRCEFALRFCRQQRSLRQREMHKLQDRWSGFEPSDAEEAVWAEHETFRDHYQKREEEASAALYGILMELRAHRRQQKAWSPAFPAAASGGSDPGEDDVEDYGDDYDEPEDCAPEEPGEAADMDDGEGRVVWGSAVPSDAEEYRYAGDPAPQAGPDPSPAPSQSRQRRPMR